MAYQKLTIPLATASDVRELVEQQIDPLLHDVHAMLRLPMKNDAGLEAGCNLTSVLVLLAVVDGVATRLHRNQHPSDNGTSFERCLDDYFPWDEEPNVGGRIVGSEASAILYRAHRDALVHNLGGIRNQDFLADTKILKGPLTEDEIESIEQSRSRPSHWGVPTLRRTNENGSTEQKLIVKCFYWGVRRMIESALKARVRLAEQAQSGP